MSCPATFYQARCELPARHPGQHRADAGAGIQTVWTDAAGDPPTPAYHDDDVTVYHGDCLTILPTLPDASVDAVITDPPYGLDFMAKHWDTGAVAFNTTVWAECLRVLKPGGHLLAFGGTRTWHRLAAAIEDAGFEIRDSIAWLYASGFPKSLDISKAIDKAAGAEREVVGEKLTGNAKQKTSKTGEFADGKHGGMQLVDITAPATDAAKQWQGWGTALKPAFEPIVVARKPLSGTVAANVVEHGVGGLNIDACRVAHNEPAGKPATAAGGRRGGIMGEHVQRTYETTSASAAGRWPPNVTLNPTTAEQLDKQSGILKSGRKDNAKIKAQNKIYGEIKQRRGIYEASEGGASRFFPVFGDEPCKIHGIKRCTICITELPTFKYEPKAPTTERPTADGTAHPTVKPVDLIRWLVRLITPPDGLILDPFAGSGTTAEAAIHEHKRCILIEREDPYLPLITARLTKPMHIGFNFVEEEETA